ncbi:MAG: outer membrane beta-barrel protein [Gammaproteobacteria bacterium]|nr:outer membrane beta-barrel protein [Gammaproteobacteria bacterium]
MLSNFSRILGAGVLLFLTQGVGAEHKLWYAAVGGGVAFANDVDVPSLPTTATMDLDTGFLVTGAVGRAFGNFRAEGEVFYIQNDISSLSAPGVFVAPSGDVSNLAFMVNGYIDVNTNSKWLPFIGGGIGGANVSINDSAAVQALQPLGVDDSDTVFAYQFKAGVAYQFTETVVGTVGYRFFGTADVDIFGTTNVQINNLEAGLRFRF